MKKKIIVAMMIALLLTALELTTFAAYNPTDYNQVQIQNVAGGVLYLNATLTNTGPTDQAGRVVVTCTNNLVGSPPAEIVYYFYNYPSSTATMANNGKLVYNVKVTPQEGGSYQVYNNVGTNMESGWINAQVYYVKFTSALSSSVYNGVYGASTVEFTLSISTGTTIANRDNFVSAFVTINEGPDAPEYPDTPPWGDETDEEVIYNLGYDTGYITGENIGYTNGYNAGYNAGYSDGRNSQVSDGVFSGIGSFLTTTIGGFMDFELMPNISIGGILTCIVGLYGLFALMRYFAGG